MIFVPDDWCSLVKNARTKNPFEVVKMEREDFVSVQNVKNVKNEIVNKKVNTQKQKVNWHSIRWMQFKSDKPYGIRYRYSHNALEAWKVLDVMKKRKGRPTDLGRISLNALYTSARPVNAQKLRDLQELKEYFLQLTTPFMMNLFHLLMPTVQQRVRVLKKTKCILCTVLLNLNE